MSSLKSVKEKIETRAFQTDEGYQNWMIRQAVRTNFGIIDHPSLSHNKTTGRTVVSFWMRGFNLSVCFGPARKPTYSINMKNSRASGDAEKHHIQKARTVAELFLHGYNHGRFTLSTPEMYQHIMQGEEVVRELVQKVREASVV